MIIFELLKLLWSFFRIGVVGFGGGYAMLSMIIAESELFGVSTEQFADLMALDMVVPGPIAINAATYVGYVSIFNQDYGFFYGVLGALFATVGVILPSFFIVTLVLHYLNLYRKNKVMNGVLSGVKPAAVGLIAAGALTIAKGVLLFEDDIKVIFKDPINSISILGSIIFISCVVINLRFKKINPILLTLIAGVIGAIFL